MNAEQKLVKMSLLYRFLLLHYLYVFYKSIFFVIYFRKKYHYCCVCGGKGLRRVPVVVILLQFTQFV